MTDVSYDALRKRVSRGAALLDERSPGWFRALTPEHIEMAYSTRCVLGRLNPEVGYLAMIYQLGLTPLDVNAEGTVVWYGFDLSGEEAELNQQTVDGFQVIHHENYARLTDVWRNLIAGRLVEAGLR